MNSQEHTTDMVAKRPGNNKRSRAKEAYEWLKKEILENRFQPGYRASEITLAEMLGMSRTPLREALVLLEQDGLIKMIPRHGMLVLSISVEQYAEISQLITGIEIMAVHILSELSDNSAEVKVLDQWIEMMRKGVKGNDLPLWTEADNGFHRDVINMTGNLTFIKVTETYRDQLNRARIFTIPLRTPQARSTENHAKLVRAIAHHDGELAMRIHWRQRMQSRIEWVKMLERFKISHL